MSNNIVAIVGRPNVGKSTLYNRLVGSREAIVDDVSGVTRDRQYGTCEWNGKRFIIIDTGGFVEGSEDVFEAAIRQQVVIAVEEASVILFMTDAAVGITDLDEEVCLLLRKSKKPVVLCVNKSDNLSRQLQATEFYSMGFEDIFFVSSMTGTGTGELLDRIAELVVDDEEEVLSDIPKLAIVGQPNVGKSSLTNALLGEDRNIVTNIAGTTRDSIHSRYTKFGHDFYLIDTAGIRKKAKVHEDLEFYSVMRALRALEECDICILVLDASMGIESQDLTLFRLARERNKGMVILMNKWDLVEKDTNTALIVEKQIRERLQSFSDVPILFVSALEKQRIFKAVEVAMEVHQNRQRRIKTSELNDFLEDALAQQQPPSHRGRFIKIKYVMQLPIAYPAFVFFCNHPKHIKESYRNYLENRMRERYNFTGVPLTLFFRDK